MKKKQKQEIGFNQDYSRSVSKDVFIKQHEHHKDDIDLAKVWEDLQEKKK